MGRKLQFAGMMSLRAKLFIGFATVLSMITLLGLVSILSVRDIDRSVTRLVEVDQRIGDAITSAGKTIAQAQVSEKSDRTASGRLADGNTPSAYSDRAIALLDQAQSQVSDIEAAGAGIDLGPLRKAVAEYSNSIEALAATYEQMGNAEFGIEGALHAAGRDIEDLANTFGISSLEAAALRAARDAQTFSDTVSDSSVTSFGNSIARLESETQSANLPEATTIEFAHLLEVYSDQFDEYVIATQAMRAAERRTDAAAAAIGPALEVVESYSDQLVIDESADAPTTSARTGRR